MRCRECGGPLVLSKYGEWVCASCGLVDDRLLLPPPFEIEPLSDFSASFKIYVSPDGKPIKRNGLGTMILRCKGQFKDRRGNVLSYKRFSRLKHTHKLYSRSAQMKMGSDAMDALRRACAFLRVPANVYERSSYIYLKALKAVKDKGSSYSLAAASLLIASRELKYPLTLREVTSLFSSMGHRVIPRTVSRVMAEILNKLNIKHFLRDPEDYLPKIVNKLKQLKFVKRRIEDLDLNDEKYFLLLMQKAYYVSKLLNSRVKVGKNPYLLAVSIVYVADKLVSKELNCKPILSQKLLALHLNSTEYTIRQHFKIIRNCLKKADERTLL